MADVTGLGTAPNRPVDTVVVRGLFNEAISQEREFAKGQLIAPVTSVPTHKGEYPVDNSWRGLDFSTAPGAATAVELESTAYEDMSIQFGSRTYECERYMLGRVAVSDRKAAMLRADNGIDLEAYIAKRFAASAAALHMYHAATALGTSGNYTTASDPGDFTSASFDLITNMESVIDTLLDQQAYAEGDPIIVAVARDMRPYLKLNTQVRNRIGTANDTVPTDAECEDFFRSYLPGARLVFLSGKYKSAAGTSTDMFSAKIAFVRASGGFEQSFLKTFVPADDSGGMLDLRTERDEAMPGTYTYGDAYYDVSVTDPDAGVLWHTLGS